jgi:electron transport complex protein RnfB
MAYRITTLCNGCTACAKLCPVGAITGERNEQHLIDEALCIECGACGRICPVEALLDQVGRPCARVSRSEWLKPRVDYKACVSCTICIEACPVDCLALSREILPKDPHGYPVMGRERACIGCGFCALECPVDAITMITPEGTPVGS